MPELCLSSSTKSAKFSNLILSDLKLFLSFIHSHPLYFCYIIFFSPYLFKLLAYLSPIFITTSLLLLGLLTVCSQPNGDFLLSAYKALREKLGAKTDTENDDFSQFEELELYKIVFDTPTFHQIENYYDNSSCGILGMGLFEGLDLSLDVKTVEVVWEETAKPVKKERDFEEFLESAKPVVKVQDAEELLESAKLVLEEKNFEMLNLESAKPVIEEKDFEEFLEPLEEFEDICYSDEKKTELPSVKLNKFDVKKEVLPVSMGSEEIASQRKGDNNVKLGTLLESPSFGSYGSMRKEKEWTRTLACKLFEERNRSDGVEGMDLLWEAYENDSSKKGKKKKSEIKKNKSKKKIDFEVCYEDDGDEDEVVGAKICCLQALKFSTGKMNMGMGRPNIAKISKAIKGFGWLHNMSRHSKRGYTSKFQVD